MIRHHPYTGPIQGVPNLQITKIDDHAKLPTRAEGHSVGLDVFAFLLTESHRPTSRAIHQKGVTEVRTGLIIRPPPGHYIQICSQLSLARKGVFVANAPGILDDDDPTELHILLYNGSFETHYVAHEHRIAQLVLTPAIRCNISEAGPPIHIGRGTAGFGSTGL